MPAPAIEHVVVLMLENRSFDHMLGFTKREDPRVEGLRGDESCPHDPRDPASPRVRVSDDAAYVGALAPSPGHEIENVAMQLYGRCVTSFDEEGDGSGYVRDYVNVTGNADAGAHVMRCFAPARVSALATLAREFAVCDHWFSSVPGPTWPNRLFVHAATSNGHGDDLPREYPMRSVFDLIEEAGRTWNVYFHDFPVSLLFSRLRAPERRGRFHAFERFLDDCANGTLPSYSFVEPRYTDLLIWRANDQHADHDVRLGELLIADTYEAIRRSPLWEKSLLLVLYDEHGGLFDHVQPPRAPNPDGKAWSSDDGALTFAFDRLGVRVPAVIASPLVPQGTVDSTVYDHASVVATLRELFGLSGPLTSRDANAASFARNLSLAEPRDTPMSLPRPVIDFPVSVLGELAATAEQVLASIEQGLVATAPASGLHRALAALASSLEVDEGCAERALALARSIVTEHDAAVHVRERISRWLASP